MSHSAIDTARLTVLLDVRHPHAMLALQPAIALARETAVDVNWLPVVSQPLKPPTRPSPDDDRGVRHRRFRAESIAREIAVYAEARGLVLEGYYRDPDPAALNLGWLWLRAEHPEKLTPFLLESFRRYWQRDLDPASLVEVAALVESLNADGDRFRSWCAGAGVALAAAIDDELRERGLMRVPAYLVEDEVFIGRQHLPMIRWILGGRVGRGPI
jgi:2-hydroxychromene-2-carboxylate isomerase